MDKRVLKLATKLGGDRGLAAVLVDAGYDTPAKVRKATNKKLEAIPGVGSATLERIRAKVPRKEP